MRGYIRLAGKVLFDDEKSLELKPEHKAFERFGEASPVTRVGMRAGCEPDAPDVYVVKCDKSDFTGSIGKVWFDNGEAVVGKREAIFFSVNGYEVERVA
jgi:hypothetical protein